MITNEPDVLIMDLLRDGNYGIDDYNTNRIDAGGNPAKHWIFTDMPRIDLVKNSYPRVGVVEVSESGEIIGLEATSEWNNIRMAFFIRTKKDLDVPKITGRATLTLTDSLQTTTISMEE